MNAMEASFICVHNLNFKMFDGYNYVIEVFQNILFFGKYASKFHETKFSLKYHQTSVEWYFERILFSEFCIMREETQNVLKNRFISCGVWKDYLII